MRVSHPDFSPDQNAVRTTNDITTSAAFGMEFDTRIIKPKGRTRGPGRVDARDVHHLNIADSTMMVNSMRAQSAPSGNIALFRDAPMSLCTASGHTPGRNC